MFDHVAAHAHLIDHWEAVMVPHWVVSRGWVRADLLRWPPGARVGSVEAQKASWASLLPTTSHSLGEHIPGITGLSPAGLFVDGVSR